MKGMYADASQSACKLCPSTTTTPGIAAKSVADCALASTNVLAAYIAHPDQVLEVGAESKYATVSEALLSRCANRCTLDKACKSYQYTKGSANQCALLYDNVDSALVHSFRPAEGTTLYEKIQQDSLFCTDEAVTTFMLSKGPRPSTCAELKDHCTNSVHGREIQKQCPWTCGTCTAARYPLAVHRSAFTRHNHSFDVQKQRFIEAYYPEFASPETCANLCLQNQKCTGFHAGIEGRLGQCILLNSNTLTLGSKESKYESELQYFELLTDNQKCPAGATSPTGRMPGCTACSQDTYQSSVTACTECPFGSNTVSVGMTSLKSCIKSGCPAGLPPPDTNKECVCPKSHVCKGPDCRTVFVNDAVANYSVGKFHVGCIGCTCEKPDLPPHIIAVTAPKFDESIAIGSKYKVKYQTFGDVGQIYVGLYRETMTSKANLKPVQSVAFNQKATGVYRWTIPTSMAPGDGYYIAIFRQIGQKLATPYKLSGRFRVVAPGEEPCPLGAINPKTGTRPCQLCPVGQYATSTRSCAMCSGSTTTTTNGAKSIDDCWVNSSNPIYNFDLIPHRFIQGSNAGGAFLEDHQLISLSECAQRCLDDAGCKSFDAGVEGLHQEGDCFLSYDNQFSVEKDRFKAVTQLNYFELKLSSGFAEPVLENTDVFTETKNCFIVGHDDGGHFENEHSPQSCAQLCMHDACCASFEIGLGALNQNDCRLSYASKKTVTASEFQCVKKDGDAMKKAYTTYYEKTTTVHFNFKQPYSEKIKSSRDKASFETFVKDALLIDSAVQQKQNGVTVGISIASDGTIACTATMTTLPEVQRVEAVILAGNVRFWWPIKALPYGTEFVGRFTSDSGPCPPGAISQSGYHGPCRTCRANTFASLSRTKCVTCPEGSFSKPGATRISDCVQAIASNSIFTVGDKWVGSYKGGSNADVGDGGMSLVVVYVGEMVRFQASVWHGKACTVKCLHQGLSEYYVEGIPMVSTSRQLLSVQPIFTGEQKGWTGITDKSIARRGFDGSFDSLLLGTPQESTVFSGIFGNALSNGSFTAKKVCSFSQNTATLQAGDVFTGWSFCAKDGSEVADTADGFQIRRLQLFVSEVSRAGDISATVHFDHSQGFAEYQVNGHMSPLPACRALTLDPTASPWITPKPQSFRSRVISGRLSEDGTQLSGEWAVSSACKCSGASPHESGIGKSCGYHGRAAPWCYVSAKCPEAAVDAEHPDFFSSECDAQPACPKFVMTRVCSETTFCPHGWSQYNDRFYKVGGEDGVPHDEAAQACEKSGSWLASVHTREESTWLTDLVVASGKPKTPTQKDALVWLGYKRDDNTSSNAATWYDGAPLIIFDVESAALQGGGCAQLQVTGDMSTTRLGDCQAKLPFVCKRPLLGVNMTCECTGKVDAAGLGGECSTKGLEGATVLPWCYTHQHCPQAVPNAMDSTSETLWSVSCFEPDKVVVTTAPPSPTECHTNDIRMYNDQGRCNICKKPSDCRLNEVLVGSCTHFASGRCLQCESTCDSCTGPRAGDCATCAKDFVMSLDYPGRCIPSCPWKQYIDAGNRADYHDDTCKACHGTCSKCDGPSGRQCTACADQLFLMQDKTRCVQDCGITFYKSRATQQCTACTQCNSTTGEQYYAKQCSEFADAQCQPATICTAAEFQTEPLTRINDRVCLSLRPPCTRGEFESLPPTATSDRKCTKCSPGTFIRDGGAACYTCSAGSYSGAGATTCAPCVPGFADDDNAPSTPCVQCDIAAQQFQDKEGQTSCRALSICPAGAEAVSIPRPDTDVRCAECTAGMFKAGAGNTQVCQIFQTCGQGMESTTTPTNTTDRICTRCPEGKFKSFIGNFRCQEHRRCLAGSHPANDRSTTNDQDCEACELGVSFSANGTHCKPVATCTVNEYETQAPSLIADRTCAGNSRPFRKCTVDEYELSPPREGKDRVCASKGACKRGEEMLDTGINPNCVPCVFGHTFKPNTGNSTHCLNVTSCSMGLEELTPPTLISDRRCKQCELGQSFKATRGQTRCVPVQPCTVGQSESVPPTTSSGPVCVACNGVTEYQDVPGQPRCKSTTVCEAGFTSSVVSSPWRDRECVACRPGFYNNGTDSNSPCLLKTTCGLGEEVVTEGTASSNPICSSCPVGKFKNSADVSSCSRVRTCGAGEQEIGAPTTSSDRVCESCAPGTFKEDGVLSWCIPISQCKIGTYAAVLATASSDVTCLTCPDGTYTSQPNEHQCKRWDHPCNPGQFEWQEATRIQNRRCDSCRPSEGKYQDTPNQMACKFVKTCSYGHFITTDASPTRNRQCAPCYAGTFTQLENTEKCTACIQGQFQNQPGQTKCKDVSTCNAGQIETAKPTATQDRQCGSETDVNTGSTVPMSVDDSAASAQVDSSGNDAAIIVPVVIVAVLLFVVAMAVGVYVYRRKHAAEEKARPGLNNGRYERKQNCLVVLFFLLVRVQREGVE